MNIGVGRRRWSESREREGGRGGQCLLLVSVNKVAHLSDITDSVIWFIVEELGLSVEVESQITHR